MASFPLFAWPKTFLIEFSCTSWPRLFRQNILHLFQMKSALFFDPWAFGVTAEVATAKVARAQSRKGGKAEKEHLCIIKK